MYTPIGHSNGNILILQVNSYIYILKRKYRCLDLNAIGNGDDGKSCPRRVRNTFFLMIVDND